MQEEKSTGMPAAVERRKDRSGLEESPTMVRMRNAPQRGGLCTAVASLLCPRIGYGRRDAV